MDTMDDIPGGEYMNPAQLAFFERCLQRMRADVLAREAEIRSRLQVRHQVADPGDRAALEEEYRIDLRLREREALLRRKIDEALRRIARGEYGYCDISGEPIGLARLLARPTATTCAWVKEHDEYRERTTGRTRGPS
ncbi:TraR/DksA family transcriptional regulator [Salinisphaera sp. PC39]